VTDGLEKVKALSVDREREAVGMVVEAHSVMFARRSTDTVIHAE
jgi:hypothetical protein